MKKFNYPQELLELVEQIAGKDSEIYSACEQGEDIRNYLEGWNKERFFTCEEILSMIYNPQNRIKLKEEANENLRKRECYELYMHSFYEEIRPRR